MTTLPLGKDIRMHDLLVAAVGFFSISFLIPVWQEFYAIDIWRHDAVFYLDSYSGKLAEEGRWVNYLLFEQLRQLNPSVAITLQLTCFALFVFIAARCLTRDLSYSFCVAVLSLAAAPLYIQLLWPNTSLPAFVALLSAALCRRSLHPWLYFALFGTLFFGTMSHLYFLLPLLFWGLLPKGQKSYGQQMRTLISGLLAPWIAGYVFGFVVAHAATTLIGDGSGIVFADWRRPNPASDIGQFITNVQTSLAYLTRDLQIHAEQLSWLQILLMLALFTRQLVRNDSPMQFIIPLLVILSLYASIIPYSVALSYRTSLTVWAGITFLFLVPRDIGAREKVAYSLLLASIVFTSSQFIQRDIHWYRTSTDFYRQELAAIVSQPAQRYKGIVLVAGREEMQRTEKLVNLHFELAPSSGIKTLGGPARWAPAARSLGFNTIRLCDGKQQFPICEKIDRTELLAGNSSPLKLYKYHSAGGWLFVSIDGDHPD
jgi:hypothetical protein